MTNYSLTPEYYQYLKKQEQMVQTLLEEIRKLKADFRELFDSIPLDYNKFSDKNFEMYSTGTKGKWIAWLNKFEAKTKETYKS